MTKHTNEGRTGYELLMTLAVCTLVTSGLLALRAYAECSHKEASYSTMKSPCMTGDCLTATNNLQACNYSEADQLVFCDCDGANNCIPTMTKVKNFLLVSYRGKCQSGSCALEAVVGSSTNTEGVIQQTVGCSTQPPG